MTNRYEFIFNGGDFEDNPDSPFPSSTNISVIHDFDAAQTWEPILWQFCRFLEHTGFEGVRKHVKVTLPTSDYLFESEEE